MGITHMKKNNIGYLLREGIRGVFLHGFMSFAAIWVTVASLLIMGTFTLVLYNLNEMIRDLDISRHTMIVMIKRRGRVLIPNGGMVLEEKDVVVLYSQKHIHHSHTIHV